MFSPLLLRGVALAASLLAGVAAAHVVLVDPKAEPGAYYTSFFRVGHGCAGSATVALRVEIPQALPAAKAQPKPGWTVTVEHAPLASPVKGEGGKLIKERVSAIVWRGGPLPDDQWDQFGVMARMPTTPGRLYFPTVQTCESGEARWTETAAGPGHSHPAPVLDVVAGGGADEMAGMDMSGMAMGDMGPSHRPRMAAAPRSAKPARAARPGKGGIAVRDAWLTAAPNGVPTAAGYLSVHNGGKADDTFLGGSTSAAGALEIHSMSMAGGIMRMRRVDGGLPLAPGETIDLTPAGGHHLMLTGLKRPLIVGDKVRAVLRFAKAGEVPVVFEVRPR